MSLAFLSCNKFEVLKDIDPEIAAAGQNLKDKTIWSFISSRSPEKAIDTLKSLNLYAAAIERVGLKSLLDGDGNYTVIVPRNNALIALAFELGYTSVDAVPAALLKNIFLDNIISKRVNSFDLPANEFFATETLNEDSLYLARIPTYSNEYNFGAYISPNALTAFAKVRSQNLECKNGIVHVVDAFSNFRPKFTVAEIVKVPGDTIFVTKDSYMNGGSGTLKRTNFGDRDYMWIKKNTNASFTRRAITQFPVRPASFTGPIASVTIGLYCNRVDDPGGIVSVYEDAKVNWNENTINWNTAPSPGTIPLSSFILNADTSSINKWHFSDISLAYKAALNNNETFINIGINSAINALFSFTTKETLDANLLSGKYRAYLVLMQPALTVLINPVNTGLIVDLKKGYKKVTTAELKFSGTTSNNITYNITLQPQNGFLVVNGLIRNSFTQAQMEKGAVKYLYSGTTAGTDSFTVSGKDNKNGTFPTPQVVNIQIQ